MPSHVLAVDQGTTGTTALVLEADGTISGHGYTELRQQYPRPGWVEHDPDDIWAGALAAAGAALADAGLAPAELAAVGITNQRETTVAWDRRSGAPVANAVVWQDRRTAPRCDALRSAGVEELVRERTGLRLDPYFSATKMGWLLDNVEGLRARAERGQIAFGTVDAWLLHRMSGGRVHATDVTNASRTLLLDLHRLAWDDDLLDIFGIPREALPTVEPSQGVVTETDPERFLGASVPVAGVLGDQQAALFAQACFEPGQAKNTYGTGSFVLVNTGDRAVTGSGRLIATVAAGVVGESPSYALEGPIFVTGSALQWLRDGLGILTDAAESEALARSVPDTGDVWFVPALAGLGAPDWDPYARGSVVGLTRGTTRAHLARAALEAIAFSTRDVLDVMRDDSGAPIDELRVDGGGAANAFLMQFQADVLGVPVDVAGQIESTALGSGLMAGLAVGVWPDRSAVAALRRCARRFEPSISADERDARHSRWRQAVARAADWSDERG